eukprot:6542042-Lingulodinium_polyedra.AAC.1
MGAAAAGDEDMEEGRVSTNTPLNTARPAPPRRPRPTRRPRRPHRRSNCPTGARRQPRPTFLQLTR